jgi:hypothetical protein
MLKIKPKTKKPTTPIPTYVDPTQTELQTLFDHYDMQTGGLFYANGKRAGSVHQASGRRIVYVRGKYLPENRVVWCYNYGVYPHQPILHKDGDKQNNRLDNLYQGHISQGKATSRHNRSGVSGVSWYEPTKKWRVTVYTPAPLHIGYYADLDEAKRMQVTAYKKYLSTPITPVDYTIDPNDDWQVVPVPDQTNKYQTNKYQTNKYQSDKYQSDKYQSDKYQTTPTTPTPHAVNVQTTEGIPAGWSLNADTDTDPSE